MASSQNSHRTPLSTQKQPTISSFFTRSNAAAKPLKKPAQPDSKVADTTVEDPESSPLRNTEPLLYGRASSGRKRSIDEVQEVEQTAGSDLRELPNRKRCVRAKSCSSSDRRK